MTTAEQQRRWGRIYTSRPLAQEPRHFANIANSVFMTEYLKAILLRCPPGASALETGAGSGHASIWLSQRGVSAVGIDNVPEIVERARQVNNILGGSALFAPCDLMHIQMQGVRYNVIHHQALLEHFDARQIRAILAQQVACAAFVVFSVPSVYYPFETEFGDERLLPLDEWKWVLEPFEIEELRYYGDPQHGEREHVLCVLRGRSEDRKRANGKRKRAETSSAPTRDMAGDAYHAGISAIVHTRNEEKNIGDCLAALKGWTDQIIVCDMESSDRTVEIATAAGAEIVLHPRIDNFDAARNVSAMRAAFAWTLYIDADERVPAELGNALRRLVLEHGDEFEAVYLPMRHYFAGEWMHCLYPGYTAPRLLKTGRFHFNPRLHSGAVVDGRSIRFPADDPNLAVAHNSYDSLAHYLEKLNRYTDGESANMMRDGQTFGWQGAIRHFVADFKMYYDHGRAGQDGVHGFLWSFLSAFYRFEQHAKLFERRYRAGVLTDAEKAVPASVEEILEFALAACREKPAEAPTGLPIVQADDGAAVLWTGPLNSPSGYGDESRDLVAAAECAGVDLACNVLPCADGRADLAENDQVLIGRLASRPVKPGFVSIVHDFPHRICRVSETGVNIGRTIFETDRLPSACVEACNMLDWIWVSTEFNRETFARSGVQPEKLRVVPQCLDIDRYRQSRDKKAARDRCELSSHYAYLSVFDWTLHKGWDILLSAFLQEFQKRDDATLLLKVWSSNGYTEAEILRQAACLARERLDIDITGDPRIRFLFDRLNADDMAALYQAADCYVMPSRCEGWGRPYMEAMATGLPVIGTGWSGNTQFMNSANSYLIDFGLKAVPEAGYREVPLYRGHRWAEPNSEHLRSLMRSVYEEREEAAAIGANATDEIASKYNRAVIGRLVRDEIERAREMGVTEPTFPQGGLPSSRSGRRQPKGWGVGEPHTPARSLGRARKSDPDHGSELTLRQTGRLLPLREEGSPLAGRWVPNDPAHPARVRWEGVFFQWHSLAHVNRELCLALEKTGQVELSLVTTDADQFDPALDPRLAVLASRRFAPLSGAAQVHVRHFFPPRWDMPDEGKLVLMQPWEYGYIPEQWVGMIAERVAEVWCNTTYVRDTYAASGVDPDKLAIVPLGVDTQVFNPQAPPYVITTEPGAERLTEAAQGRFTFLFAGGTLHRKGIDILLDAYTRAFSSIDNVCLVIKDTGTRTVYHKQNEQERILQMASDASRAPIVYLDDDLPAHQMAGIFTAANCIVQPYRGEGFCLPVLEAMACGAPAVVPAGGPTDDFVDDTVGWRIDAEHKQFGDGRIGPWVCAGPTWLFEVPVDALAKLLREIAANPEEAKRRGQAAAERVAGGWTWQHAAAVAAERLRSLGRAPGRQVTERLESGRDAHPTINPKGKRAAPAISLCMIVRDEERVLGECLASAKPWFDEIIVVDTGSTDRTVEIAQESGAKVFHFPWIDDFSAARNDSLSHATGDWVMWMDADDTLPPECGAKLHDLALMAGDSTTGYLMQVQIPPAPGEHGFTIVDHVKMFRNRPELRFEGRIHEQILEAINRAGGQVERSGLHVVHSGYDYRPEGQRKKQARDLRHLEKDLQDRPDHPFVLFNIGMTAYHLKEFAKAEAALNRCLALSKPHESTVRKVYAMLAGCHLEQRDIPGAVAVLGKGLALYPRDPELLFRAGIIYREAGDLVAAEQSYLHLLNDREQGHIDSLDVSMTGFKAHHNLALIYRDMGRPADAEREFRVAVQLQPTFVPSWLGIVEICEATRRFSDAEAVLKQVREIEAGQSSHAQPASRR